MNKLNIKTAELFNVEAPFLKELFEKSTYPWEILPQIKVLVAKLLETGIPGYHELEPGILVGENVKIAKTATIEAPAIIGKDTELSGRWVARLQDAIIPNSSAVPPRRRLLPRRPTLWYTGCHRRKLDDEQT